MKYTEIALFTDMDGTLLNSRSEVSEKNQEAIRRFTAQGGLFGVSSGRGPLNAKERLSGVELNSWSVVLNGCEAYHYGQNRAVPQAYLDTRAAQTLIDWILREHPEVGITLFSEDKLLYVSDLNYADPAFMDSHHPMEILSLEQAKAYRWLKILCYGPRPVLEVVKAHGKKAGVEPALACIDTQPMYMEYMPPNINKGLCLKALRQQPEFAGRTIVAVGDYYNDLELLQESDIAVAVSNALPEIKAVSDYVICSNDEDALAYLIDTLIPSLD